MTVSDREGVGCRTPVLVLALFLGLLVVGSVVFFTADPGSVPFWRLWLFSSFAPVSGVAMSFGATGMAWTLDVVAWVLVAAWIGRAGSASSLRLRLSGVVVLALLVGLVASSAG